MASKADDTDETAPRSGETLARPQFGGGRLGTYTLLGGATGIVPLPWVPDAIVRRIRGALVHDLLTRHGLSITPEARSVLVDGVGSDRGLVNQGVKFAVTRVLGRLGPLAVLGPLRSALGTFALGHLLQRYIDQERRVSSVRLDVVEARRVREAIDQALVAAVTTDSKGTLDLPPHAAEDLRDSTTQFVDGVVISVASAPAWIVGRLEAAFDATIAKSRS